MTSHIKPGSVVVGVNGSPDSDAAAVWAATYAAIVSRPLCLVSATGTLSAGERLGDPVESRRLRRTTARRDTEAAMVLARRVSPHLDISEVHPVADPADALVDLSHLAALVCVGSRGHGPVATTLLGSVSVAVAARAGCPVAVVRPREYAGAGMVVGVSGDPSDQSALELALELASLAGTRADAVHAYVDGSVIADASRHLDRSEQVSMHRRSLEEALSGLREKFPDVDLRSHLVNERPSRALVRLARGADCLVVGCRGRTGLRAVLGSVSRDVLEHAPCTVVVVPS